MIQAFYVVLTAVSLFCKLMDVTANISPFNMQTNHGLPIPVDPEQNGYDGKPKTYDSKIHFDDRSSTNPVKSLLGSLANGVGGHDGDFEIRRILKLVLGDLNDLQSDSGSHKIPQQFNNSNTKTHYSHVPKQIATAPKLVQKLKLAEKSIPEVISHLKDLLFRSLLLQIQNGTKESASQKKTNEMKNQQRKKERTQSGRVLIEKAKDWILVLCLSPDKKVIPMKCTPIHSILVCTAFGNQNNLFEVDSSCFLLNDKSIQLIFGKGKKNILHSLKHKLSSSFKQLNALKDEIIEGKEKKNTLMSNVGLIDTEQNRDHEMSKARKEILVIELKSPLGKEQQIVFISEDCQMLLKIALIFQIFGKVKRLKWHSESKSERISELSRAKDYHAVENRGINSTGPRLRDNDQASGNVQVSPHPYSNLSKKTSNVEDEYKTFLQILGIRLPAKVTNSSYPQNNFTDGEGNSKRLLPRVIYRYWNHVNATQPGKYNNSQANAHRYSLFKEKKSASYDTSHSSPKSPYISPKNNSLLYSNPNLQHANHEQKRTFAENVLRQHSAQETCQQRRVPRLVGFPGCRARSLIFVQCAGTCLSRSVPEWNAQKQEVQHVSHCTCCAPNVKRTIEIRFHCPSRNIPFIRRRFGVAIQCRCRPCDILPEVEAQQPYDY